MSMVVTDFVPLKNAVNNSSIEQVVRVTVECDSIADLPAMNYTTTSSGTLSFAQGSKAHIIEDNTWYMLKGDGTWVLQVPESEAYTYTKAEIDAMTGALEDAIDLDESVLSSQLDSGAKNRCPVNSGSNTLPTRWFQIPLVLPVGVYKVKIGTLASDDTDASTCQFVCFDSGNNTASNYLYLERGTDVVGTLTITTETSYCRLYPSDSYAHSENDTVTATDLMICTFDDYEISDKYVDYCPTLAELYAMVRGYHP